MLSNKIVSLFDIAKVFITQSMHFRKIWDEWLQNKESVEWEMGAEKRKERRGRITSGPK